MRPLRGGNCKNLWSSAFRTTTLPFSVSPTAATLNAYEQSIATQYQAGERSRVSRDLRQQRPGASQCLGFLSGLRNPPTTERNPGGGKEFPRYLSEPATSQSSDVDLAAKRLRL